MVAVVGSRVVARNCYGIAPTRRMTVHNNGSKPSTGQRAREDRVAGEFGATGAWVDGRDAEAKAKASLREDGELEVQCSWRCCDKRRKGAVCRACALRVALQVPCVLGGATRDATGWLSVSSCLFAGP